MKRLLIKVCGMREPDNIRRVEALRPDYMGFICWAGSRRNVTGRPDYLPAACRRTGVFVDPSPTEVAERVEQLGLDAVQLHGHETPEFCRAVKQICGRDGQAVELVKAFSIAPDAPFPVTADYETACDYFLFDTSCPTAGGSGRTFDWDVLTAYDGRRPFFLSGGIGPDSIEALRHFDHPRWAGVDLNSRFEISPALKDAEALSRFIKALKEQTDGKQ